MYFRILGVFLVLGLVACAQAPKPIPSIVGRWTMPDLKTASAEEGCVSYVEFFPDGRMSSRAGDAVITGEYQLIYEKSKLFLIQKNLIGNGKKNCQGLDSEFIVNNTMKKARVEVEGDSLKTYMTRNPTKYFLLVKSRQ